MIKAAKIIARISGVLTGLAALGLAFIYLSLGAGLADRSSGGGGRGRCGGGAFPHHPGAGGRLRFDPAPPMGALARACRAWCLHGLRSAAGLGEHPGGRRASHFPALLRRSRTYPARSRFLSAVSNSPNKRVLVNRLPAPNSMFNPLQTLTRLATGGPR